MIQIEEYDAKDKQDKSSRERFWVEEFGASLNGQIPGRTDIEWRRDNSEKIKARDAKYYAENKEKIAARKAKYRSENKEKIKAQEAKYYADNPEKIKARMAKYYAENKEKIAVQGAKKIECECGSIMRKDGLPRHRKTKKHLRWVETK
jgi:hypothetical protein